MIYKITSPAGGIDCRIELPASKSISNRAIVIDHLCGGRSAIANVAKCDDTDVMIAAFGQEGMSRVDIGAAGTSMRFLTAFLSQMEGRHHITGSERMKKRPIKILVDALRAAGADIEYAGEEGFPPLCITGHALAGGRVSIDSGVSSQYISALMMVAPVMEQGLQIELQGRLVSQPYILMTAQLMQEFGARVSIEGNVISIEPQKYSPRSFTVENDWSAASYWYQTAALSGSARIELPHLFEKSCQGDQRVKDLFVPLGVGTSFTGNGIELVKTGQRVEYYEQNLVEQPDLAQTIVVTCCLLGVKFKLTGLGNLKIKETDRIAALINECRKTGYVITETEEGTLEWDGQTTAPDESPVIKTYEDHRMAMAFAPVCLKRGEIRIEDPHVVSKSYPLYWDNLSQAGFTVEQE